jgi:hypothetical protein
MSHATSTNPPSPGVDGEHQILREGLLMKKRNGFGRFAMKKWPYRYFKLSNEGHLSYYEMGSPHPNGTEEDVEEEHARGRVNLCEKKFDLIREPDIDGAPTSFAIQINIEDEEPWLLCVDTEEDYKLWLIELEHFVKHNGSTQVTSIAGTPTPTKKKSIFSFGGGGYDSDTKQKNNANNGGNKNGGGIEDDDYGAPNGNKATGNVMNHTKSNSSKGDNSMKGRTRKGSMKGFAHKSGKGGHGGGGLKIAQPTSRSILEDVFDLELIVTLIIVNYCVFLAYYYHTSPPADLPDLNVISQSLYIPTTFPLPMVASHGYSLSMSIEYCTVPNFSSLLTGLYLLVGNFMLLCTLALRGRRVAIAAVERDKAIQEKSQALVTASLTSVGGVATRNSIKLSSSAKDSPIAHKGATTLTAESVLDEEDIADEGLPMKDGKPIAGCTFEEVYVPQRLAPEHTWSKIDHSDFHVRIGPNYSYNKKKAPSPPALYDAFAVDVFCSHTRADHATQRFHLPEEYSSIDTHHKYVPPIMVVQIQIPADEPPLLTTKEDGPGWAIMMYFKISEQTLAELKDIDNASPAVKLWVSIYIS